QQVEAFGAYPFSRHHRFEVGGALARYSYRAERWWQGIANNNYFESGRERIPTDEIDETPLGYYYGNMDPFSMVQLNSSFVGDNAVFGIAAPLQGYRYRAGVEQYFGDLSFTAYNLDVRKYNRYAPVTVA